ncbi:MAG: hypothetical protein F6J98_02120 [Moorea sp. SIO4G2]|nr:hypothetical protein [Moorena sp. SIO4G2]
MRSPFIAIGLPPYVTLYADMKKAPGGDRGKNLRDPLHFYFFMLTAAITYDWGQNLNARSDRC